MKYTPHNTVLIIIYFIFSFTVAVLVHGCETETTQCGNANFTIEHTPERTTFKGEVMNGHHVWLIGNDVHLDWIAQKIEWDTTENVIHWHYYSHDCKDIKRK